MKKSLLLIATALSFSYVVKAAEPPPPVVALYPNLADAWNAIDRIEDMTRNVAQQADEDQARATNGPQGDFASHRVFVANYLSLAGTAIQNAKEEILFAAQWKHDHPNQKALSPVPPMLELNGYTNN